MWCVSRSHFWFAIMDEAAYVLSLLPILFQIMLFLVRQRIAVICDNEMAKELIPCWEESQSPALGEKQCSLGSGTERWRQGVGWAVTAETSLNLDRLPMFILKTDTIFEETALCGNSSAEAKILAIFSHCWASTKAKLLSFTVGSIGLTKTLYSQHEWVKNGASGQVLWLESEMSQHKLMF